MKAGSEALQSLIYSCSSSMKKSFKQNNQSFRSQKQTEHNQKNKQNNQSNTEQSKPKGSQQNQSKKNQIKELVKSFNKILNGNQKPKGNSFTGQQNHNSSTQQRAATDQNPYIYIKQCEMNNCFDRKQQNQNNDAYKKNWKKYSWNQEGRYYQLDISLASLFPAFCKFQEFFNIITHYKIINV
ncbi:Hypothetical_protein [Hexamita inflata]|uniref:Hypothetical_protein n=1 Tax=Hexamita inflata TaxID=28002 RepID=A0AA86QH98_9EUKA|nr:Hypothetical protein HINF_LOCUS46999 [Hexamita inflata]